MSTQVSIKLLADHPHLVRAVAEMRWREWGDPAPPASPGLAGWVDVTLSEVGRGPLPITWVAVDPLGKAVGAAALVEIPEIAEKPEYVPTLGGVIVVADRRLRGIGRGLLAAVEQWAMGQGIRQLWVLTGGEAVRFYEACGWVIFEELTRIAQDGGELESVTFLRRALDPQC